MRRMTVALVLLLLPVATTAGTHRAGAGGGVGWVDSSSLYGVVINGELVLRHYGERSPKPLTLSAVADFALMDGDHDDKSITQYTLVVGGRLTVNSLNQLQPFGHAMVGGYWADGKNSSATVLGVGCDIPLGKVTSEGHPHWVFRLQYDKFWINAQERSYPQLTGQIVYRFE